MKVFGVLADEEEDHERNGFPKPTAYPSISSLSPTCKSAFAHFIGCFFYLIKVPLINIKFWESSSLISVHLLFCFH